MSHELKEGVHLNAITTMPDADSGCDTYRVGGSRLSENGTARITDIVVMEQTGQMAMVPWAGVSFSDGRVVLVNLANVESVELAMAES